MDSERSRRITAGLLESGLDAAICTSASAVLLLTGYWPVMGASVAIFSAEGEAHVILPEDETELAEHSSGATRVPYKPSPLSRITTPIEALANPLCRLIARLGLSRARVGIEIDQGMQPASYVASADFRSSLRALLRKMLPHANLIDCSDTLEQMKASKTPTELEIMRLAAEIASSGFALAAEQIRAGSREAEVAASLHAAFQSSTQAERVQRSYGFFFCMSGPNSAKAAAAYARSRERKIEDGDLVMIHANTCADGYWTDITRTYTAGAPTDRQDAMRGAIREARNAALDAIRPGALARDIDGTARSVMAAHGFGDAFKHSTGHGVGFAAANGNALPRIHPQSTDVLQVGMTFNIEPAAYFDGYGGMRHCDVVAVTSDGVEVLTEF
jgi:Xaa-Pro aminopeptidase